MEMITDMYTPLTSRSAAFFYGLFGRLCVKKELVWFFCGAFD